MRRAKSKTPMRRCVACRGSRPQEEMIRFTLQGGRLAADDGAKADGRGSYLCKNRACADEAVKRKAFNRAYRRNLDTDDVIKVIENAFNNN